MIHVSALIAKARAALAPAGLGTALTVVPGLDQAMIEKICTLNSDADTQAQPAPFNFFVTGEMQRVTHILSGLSHDPDGTFRTTTDQFANMPNQNMRTLVYMLESYTQTFDFHSKREAKQRERLSDAENESSDSSSDEDEKEEMNCDYCETNRPGKDCTNHTSDMCFFNPESPKFRRNENQKGASSNKDKAKAQKAAKVKAAHAALKAARAMVAQAEAEAEETSGMESNDDEECPESD
jgi:hypothetical protein